jgi:hypothetical protein
MKENNLFCFVNMRSTKLGHFRLCSWYFWKLSMRRDASTWVYDVWTSGAKVLEY